VNIKTGPFYKLMVSVKLTAMKVISPVRLIVKGPEGTITLTPSEIAIFKIKGKLLIFVPDHAEWAYIVENRAELEAVIKSVLGPEYRPIGLEEH